MKPILYIIIPCYNEEAVLPKTAPLFLDKLISLINRDEIDDKSRILFVNDGSLDKTRDIIFSLSSQNEHYSGISLSRNRGHQNALLAGLSEATDRSDITISLDCDGQDDIDAVDLMLREYKDGCDIVYGVRSSRETDSFLKRTTAKGFYRLMSFLGAETVYNHADYRLISNRVLKELASYREVNLFLRGLLPLVGFKSTCVYYKRKERLAGKTKYPLKKMLHLALDGITSCSTKPLHLVTTLGFFVTALSFIGIIWSVIRFFLGATVSGWASLAVIICFLGGIQLLSIGIIGEYIAKIYLETKARPRFIVSERTDEKKI